MDKTKWEYLVLSIEATSASLRDDTVSETLNKQGQDRWELVSTMPTDPKSFRQGLRLLFKRPE